MVKRGVGHVRVPDTQRGVTLIELLVGLTILAVIAAAAVPTFVEFRERGIARGAADQLSAFWTNARFEAVRRNRLVRVSFVREADGTTCVGASALTDTAANRADDTACDCFTPGDCDVGSFPAAQADWRGATWLADPTFGDSSSGVLIIDPRNGFLTQASDDGQVTVGSPNSDKQARLRLVIDAQGRAGLCEPTDAPLKISEYFNKQC